MAQHRIETVEALRALYPPPKGPSAIKVMSSLDRHARRFLELCPFLVLATAVVDEPMMTWFDKEGNF